MIQLSKDCRIHIKMHVFTSLFLIFVITTTVDSTCLNLECYSDDECCASTFCLLEPDDESLGGRCVGRHAQPVGQLCSKANRYVVSSTVDTAECGDDMYCDTNLADSMSPQPVGICRNLHNAYEGVNNYGDECQSTLDCNTRAKLCCRRALHGRSKFERHCDEFDSFVVDCEFD